MLADNLLTKLKQAVARAAGLSAEEIEIEIPSDPVHGDLTTNVAMRLASVKKQPPLEVARAIATVLSHDSFVAEFFSSFSPKTAVKPPGFINFFYNQQYLQEVLRDILKTDQYGKGSLGKGKTVVVEYSSPNTNKPLHLGHLRNDALGMALAKIMEFLGYQVVKTSVINDRGIHIMYSLLAYHKWGEGRTPESEQKKGDHFVGDYYVRFNQELKKNPELREEAADWLRRWEAGDSEVRQLWQRLNAWVYDGWQRTYDFYGSEFDRLYYESELYDQGRELVARGVKQGVFKKNEQGAVVADLSVYGLGGRDSGEKVLLRADGTTVYITQDLYLAYQRYQDYKFDRLFYVVADEQNYHFQVLFKIFELLNFKWSKNCRHYSYGMVDLPSGRMKSREGTVVDADELLAELKKLAITEVKKRRADVAAAEAEEIAVVVAAAAVKYWFLKSNPKSRIIFNPAESLDFEGDTGPYLLYTYVRLRSILRRAGKEEKEEKIEKVVDEELSREELGLVRRYAAWPQVVGNFVNHYHPNIICEYLFQLASKLNSYYQSVPVLAATGKTRQQRLQVIAAGSQILKKGLELLNIKTVEKM